ncbi:MAG: tetratricopeptide repeat protein [Planctomycetes bacterium]|nr:tetratricopeptide repeat protein [Planctomycetota bacterium]
MRIHQTYVVGLTMCLTTLLFTITGCGSKPSEIDGVKELKEAYNNLVRVVNFKKTDGKPTEFKGVKGYEMEYEAEIEFLTDVFDSAVESGEDEYKGILKEKGERDQIKGVIVFEKTERGWRRTELLTTLGANKKMINMQLKSFSLSDKTKSILKEIERPITIEVIFVHPQSSVTDEDKRKTFSLFDEYKIYSRGKITVKPIITGELKLDLKLGETPKSILSLKSNPENISFTIVVTLENNNNTYNTFKGEKTLTPAIMQAIGTVYFNKNDYNKSIKCYLEASSLDDKLAEVYVLIGKSYKQLNNINKATESYEKGFALGNIECGVILGERYFNQNKFNEALNINLTLIKSDPDNYQHYHNIAVIFDQLGRLDEAIEYSKKALDLVPPTQKVSVTKFLKKLEEKKAGNSSDTIPNLK